MTTSIGPQSPNYTLTRPATNTQVSAGADTWAQDCTSAAANDGTVLTASFFNILIAQLRYTIRTAGITLDDSDPMLYLAIQAIAANALSSVDTLLASKTLTITDNSATSGGNEFAGLTFTSTLGTGARQLLT